MEKTMQDDPPKSLWETMCYTHNMSNINGYNMFHYYIFEAVRCQKNSNWPYKLIVL